LLFPGEWTIDTSQSYAQMADGSMLANLVVAGKLPTNTFSPGAMRQTALILSGKFC